MGQVGDAMKNPVTFQQNPQGFSGSEWGARFLGKGLQGLGQGVQDYQQQNQALRGAGGAPQINPMMTQQPNVQLPGLNQPQRRGPNDLNFYGSSY